LFSNVGDYGIVFDLTSFFDLALLLSAYPVNLKRSWLSYHDF